MEKPKPKTTLYIGGLEEKVNEEILHAAFIPFGDVIEVHIPKDWEKGTHRGFGFVEFEEEGDAMAAAENMDGSELYGKVLRVNVAKPIKHKLGASKPVWSADEWFKSTLHEGDETINMTGDDLQPADPLQPLGT